MAGEQPAADEELIYRWKLGGFVGALAGIFLPDEGDGSLRSETVEGGRLQSELRITSSKSRDGEFWLYGSEIDPADSVTVRAWSEYLWRGKRKNRSADLAGQEVSDIVSGIHRLRRQLPDEILPLRIWSDGKIYPVQVVPGPRERKRVGGREVVARLYSVRGRNVPGESKWKGTLDLWLAEDAAATPVEIVIDRGWARVRLSLVEIAD